MYRDLLLHAIYDDVRKYIISKSFNWLKNGFRNFLGGGPLNLMGRHHTQAPTQPPNIKHA